MSVIVHFINKSGERVTLYEGNGLLKVLEAGKCWNRDPKEGTLDTVMVDEVHGQKFPAPRPRPYWIDKTEWTYEECPEHSIYAPYRTIVFEDGNVVKLKHRPHWKPPEMEWPIVSFLFKSHNIKMRKERLEEDFSTQARSFFNGIPVRITVHPLSRYAPFRKWIFDEELVLKNAKDPFKPTVRGYESTERGEDKRPANELERIAELKAKDEERQKLGMF